MPPSHITRIGFTDRFQADCSSERSFIRGTSVDFTVSMLGVEGIYRTAVGYIVIGKSQIEAVMDGGTSRAVGHGKNTSASCSQTKDPDVEVNDPKGSYDSRLLDNCTQLPAFPLAPMALSSSENDTNNDTQVDENGCFGYPSGRLNTSSPKITFSTLVMKPYWEYDVCVQVMKDTRKSIACTSLKITPGDPSNVGIL
ncbi:hypothetical protein OS493_026734 [Desmophyllum pertusum]|uniref:PKD/REJ-like domain-containing protein n=1 Tax=Desmophyllum pertusum TaxID=174260 RepID=A0A9X0D959_9CNID|nr:hypothetical protein OS493_026734 [Desmophyllum pertusum]